jgi:hypothetical protein
MIRYRRRTKSGVGESYCGSGTVMEPAAEEKRNREAATHGTGWNRAKIAMAHIYVRSPLHAPFNGGICGKMPIRLENSACEVEQNAL